MITLAKDIYSIRDVAELLEVTEKTVRNWLSGGTKGILCPLSFCQIGKKIFISREALKYFIDIHYHESPEPRAKTRSLRVRRIEHVKLENTKQYLKDMGVLPENQ